MTVGGVTTVVQTVDGDAAELVRRLFDWMEDESECEQLKSTGCSRLRASL